MVKKSYVSALMWVAVSVFAVLLFLQGVKLEWEYLRPFSMASGAVVATIALFERIAWRIPFLYPWFVSLPDLNGRWKVVLTSNWTDAEGNAIPPIDADAEITQSFTQVTLRLQTAESNSLTMTCSLTQHADKTFEMTGVYQNRPDVMIRDRSQIHFGAFLLSVPSGRRPQHLNGQYWTDRNTAGRMELTR